MDIYEKYCNDKDINKILYTVNDINKGIFTACHGRYHVMFVVDMVEYGRLCANLRSGSSYAADGILHGNGR